MHSSRIAVSNGMNAIARRAPSKRKSRESRESRVGSRRWMGSSAAASKRHAGRDDVDCRIQAEVPRLEPRLPCKPTQIASKRSKPARIALKRSQHALNYALSGGPPVTNPIH